MTTIIANDIPSAARGLLKRWFIEPKANVFVGSVNARTREKTLDYIRRNAPDSAMLVVFDEKNAQGFTILTYGKTDRATVRMSGLELIRENPDETDAGGRVIENT